MFRGSVKGTGYPLHSPVSPSLPCVTECHHISTGLYCLTFWQTSLFFKGALVRVGPPSPSEDPFHSDQASSEVMIKPTETDYKAKGVSLS